MKWLLRLGSKMMMCSRPILIATSILAIESGRLADQINGQKWQVMQISDKNGSDDGVVEDGNDSSEFDSDNDYGSSDVYSQTSQDLDSDEDSSNDIDSKDEYSISDVEQNYAYLELSSEETDEDVKQKKGK